MFSKVRTFIFFLIFIFTEAVVSAEDTQSDKRKGYSAEEIKSWEAVKAAAEALPYAKHLTRREKLKLAGFIQQERQYEQRIQKRLKDVETKFKGKIPKEAYNRLVNYEKLHEAIKVKNERVRYLRGVLERLLEPAKKYARKKDISKEELLLSIILRDELSVEVENEDSEMGENPTKVVKISLASLLGKTVELEKGALHPKAPDKDPFKNSIRFVKHYYGKHIDTQLEGAERMRTSLENYFKKTKKQDLNLSEAELRDETYLDMTRFILSDLKEIETEQSNMEKIMTIGVMRAANLDPEKSLKEFYSQKEEKRKQEPSVDYPFRHE